MKKLILFLGILTSYTAAQAQDLEYDIELGLNFSKLFKNESNITSKTRIGGRGGSNTKIPIAKNLYIAPGLFYTVKGGKAESQIDANNYDKVTIELGYFELPLNLVYKYPIKYGAIMLSGGGYYGFAIHGSAISEGKTAGISYSENEDIKFGNTVEQVKRHDFGINFGLGYEFPNRLYIRGQYQKGLSKINNTSDKSFYNSGFIFSVGYNFKSFKI